MPGRARDPLIVVLELGLCAAVLVAPLPFASVGRGGRLMLEIGGTLLGACWAVRAALRGVRLPPRAAVVGLVGLLVLCALQIVPVGRSVLTTLSPRGAALPLVRLSAGLGRRRVAPKPRDLDPSRTGDVGDPARDSEQGDGDTPEGRAADHRPRLAAAPTAGRAKCTAVQSAGPAVVDPSLPLLQFAAAASAVSAAFVFVS